MDTHLIVYDGLSGYGVELSAPAHFRSVRGFKTEVEAQLWIDEQVCREAAGQPAAPP